MDMMNKTLFLKPHRSGVIEVDFQNLRWIVGVVRIEIPKYLEDGGLGETYWKC